MLRKILVGLDGTSYSAHAVELGLNWARRYNATVSGIAVCDEPTIRRPEPVPMGAVEFKHWRDEALLVEARQRVHEFLADFSERCTTAGVACEQIEAVGVPHEQIELEAQRHDLVLMGQQTYFHFEVQDYRCETLETVLRHSVRPVVAVPEPIDRGNSVVVAYDGSPRAARALQALVGLGLCEADEVFVVAVGSHAEPLEECTARAVDYLAAHGVSGHSHPVESTSAAAEVLLAQTDELRARLLVMGAFGHSTLREFFLGSVTRSVLRDSTVPVFLYH
jgi:nucleotide-binding universal stress UspA family protein